MSAPTSVIVWEMAVHNNANILGVRVFVTGTKAGSQILPVGNERPRWEIRTFTTADDAKAFAISRMQEWERNGTVTITVQPGEVGIHESEYNRLIEGSPIHPALRGRLFTHLMRHRRSVG